MYRFHTLAALVLLADSLHADSPSVAELVKQLGDPRYVNREAAQRELVKRGEGIVPELDRLTKGVDAETSERSRKVRYQLVGYLDDIRRLLPKVDDRPDYIPTPIAAELRDLITGHQPRAGDFLLECTADPKNRFYLQARRAFVQTWASATSDQLDRFIQLRVYLSSEHRPKFPAKVAALISMEAKIRDGWSGWFSIDGETPFVMKTRTTRYLDGKPYDKPFEYRHPFATVGWYRVGELFEGKHAIHAILEYEFTHRGEKRKGEIRSTMSEFKVVAAGTPDLLIAPKSQTRFKHVKEAIELISAPPPLELTGQIGLQGFGHPEPEEIHVSWVTTPGKRAGLRCPRWQIRTPLDVDLCFDVEIHDVKSGKIYLADPIIVHKGQLGSGYLMPRDTRAFAGDRDGFVTIKVVRKPSRAMALTDPKITSYFPETITTDDLRIKVFKEIPFLDPYHLSK